MSIKTPLKNEAFQFSSPVSDVPIFYQNWLPESGEVKKIFIIQHGIGEHSGRYGNIIEALNDGLTGFFALDSRGHGRSGGKRGHSDHFDDYSTDLEKLVSLARDQYPDTPFILFGHSMGGAIALNYCLKPENQKEVQALIVSAPALQVVMDPVKKIKKFLGEKLAKVLPAMTVESGLELKYLSHDPQVISEYEADPLVHGKVSFQMGKTLFEIGDRIMENASSISLPIYIFHGEEDGLISPNGSKELFSKVSSQNKKLSLHPGLYHETINESPQERTMVLNGIKGWVENLETRSL